MFTVFINCKNATSAKAVAAKTFEKYGNARGVIDIGHSTWGGKTGVYVEFDRLSTARDYYNQLQTLARECETA